MTKPLFQATMPVVLIGLCGAAGVLARYGMDRLLSRLLGERPLLPTASVNLLGCFLMGLVLAGFPELPGLRGLPGLAPPGSPWRQAITVGFLGGFTTFSAFAAEALLLQQQGNLRAALSYFFLLPAGCVLMVGAGFSVAARICGAGAE